MKKVINFFIRVDKFILIPGLLTAGLFIVTAAYLLIFASKLPPQLPLLYSLPWGEDQLVSKADFIFLPAILVGLTAINFILAWQLHSSQNTLKRMLMLSIILFDIMGAATIFKILTIFI